MLGVVRAVEDARRPQARDGRRRLPRDRIQLRRVEQLADRFEVEEAGFFPLAAPPPQTSPATLRRLAEYRGEAELDDLW